MDSEIATKLKNEKIKVYAIHIGDDQVPDEVTNIAEMTGGASFPAGDKNGLDLIFNTIEQMSKSKLKRLTPNPVDYYHPFVITGLSLLGLHILFPSDYATIHGNLFRHSYCSFTRLSAR
jgi:Ca-activated chloride channel family protein